MELDALPEDETCEVNDLVNGRVQREVNKLYAGFQGAKEMHKHLPNCSGSCIIEAGAWGCGAFGGNVLVKTACMMIAAGLTGIELKLTLLEQRKDDIELVRRLLNKSWTVGEMWQAVTTANNLQDIIDKEH